jgi:hypothetical protein
MVKLKPIISNTLTLDKFSRVKIGRSELAPAVPLPIIVNSKPIVVAFAIAAARSIRAIINIFISPPSTKMEIQQSW